MVESELKLTAAAAQQAEAAHLEEMGKVGQERHAQWFGGLEHDLPA